MEILGGKPKFKIGQEVFLMEYGKVCSAIIEEIKDPYVYSIGDETYKACFHYKVRGERLEPSYQTVSEVDLFGTVLELASSLFKSETLIQILEWAAIKTVQIEAKKQNI